jgi:hypothetical protein
MQPTGRQQRVGQSGEAPHAHITTAPVRGLREVGHAKLRFHQCLPSVNRPLTTMISRGRLLEPRWRLMVKSSLKLATPNRSRQSSRDRRGSVSLNHGWGLPQPFSWSGAVTRPESSGVGRQGGGNGDMKWARDGQFMTMEVVNCFLKIGRVACRRCHILDVRTTAHRPAGNRYALNRRHDQRSRGSTG